MIEASFHHESWLCSKKRGAGMSKETETPEIWRERLRQEEVKQNPAGNVSDAFNKNENGNLADLVGGLGWKVTGISLIVLMVFTAALLFLKT